MSSKWARTFTETIKLKRRLTVDTTGKMTYRSPVDIKARTDIDIREVVIHDGNRTTCSMLVLTEMAVRPGDILIIDDTEWTIQWAFAAKGLGGVIDHYEARM